MKYVARKIETKSLKVTLQFSPKENDKNMIKLTLTSAIIHTVR